MDECVSIFPKNKFEEIRVQIKEFKGYDLVDIRVFAGTKDGEDKVPTGKGISINVSHFTELRQAITKTEEILRKNQLLND
jgi:hypothetical protein